MTAALEHVWDAQSVQRAIRVLGVQGSRVGDSAATARALRVIWEMLARRGLPSEVFQLPGIMPLLVVGNGPILLVTYLDDANPELIDFDGAPPDVSGDTVTGPGISRKAGVLGVIGAMLAGGWAAENVTLVVESDRHLGSVAVKAWLDGLTTDLWAAAYEVIDLPVPAPRLYRAATGLIVMSVVVCTDVEMLEDTFAGVLPDVGHQLAEALATIKSRDSEVLIPGFYDGIDALDAREMAAIQDVCDSVGAWISRAHTPSGESMSIAHLTLGTFCVPSILIRELSIRDAQPFMANRARATLEIRLMPNQDVTAVSRAVVAHFRERLPNAEVEVLLARPPARGWVRNAPDTSNIAPTLALAPGDSPAGILEAAGIPTIGFATVARDAATRVECASIIGILRASSMVETLCHVASKTLARPVR